MSVCSLLITSNFLPITCVIVLASGKIITKFIYKHNRLLSTMHIFTHEKELLNPRVIWFTHFFALQTLYVQKMNLKQMFVSTKLILAFLITWMARYLPHFSMIFCLDAQQIVKISNLLVKFFKLVYRKKSLVGYFYETIDMANQAIRTNMHNDKKKFGIPIGEIINDKWHQQTHYYLYVTWYYLNPTLFYGETFKYDAKMTKDLFKCMRYFSLIQKNRQSNGKLLQICLCTSKQKDFSQMYVM